MTSSVSTLAAWLARFKAFEGLDPDDLNWLASRAKPFHCGVGQELLSADRLPEYCYAVVEGKGRVLHNDPGLPSHHPGLFATGRSGGLGRSGPAALEGSRPSVP